MWVIRTAAGAGRTERIDAQIFGFDLDVDVLGFGQHGDRYSRSVDTSLLLGGGNALHAVDSAFILELREDAVAFDDGDDFFQASGGRFGGGEHFDLPALGLGIAGVHAEDFGGEECGLVASSAGADFQDDVLVVVGILGEEQHFQICLDCTDARLKLGQFVLGVGAHLRILFVGEHGFAVGDAFRQILVLAVFFDNGRDFGVGLGSLLVFPRVARDLRRSESFVEFFVAGFDLVEAFKHAVLGFQFSVLGSQLKPLRFPGSHHSAHTNSR
jgi:hypothetical protein